MSDGPWSSDIVLVEIRMTLKERLTKMVEDGRITVGMMKRILRQAAVRNKKFLKAQAKHEKLKRMYARGRRNLERFEARTGLEGTCPGGGRYWAFDRNVIQLWPTRITWRRR
jgi:hypothetical protein